MKRREYLLGRVRKILIRNNVGQNDVVNEDIYDALSNGQNQIFALVNFEREYSIYLIADEAEYELVQSDKDVIGGIKQFITPTAWTYSLTPIRYSYWEEIKKRGLTSTQPLYATIFNNKLILEPAPSTDDEELKIWATLKSPEEDITKDDEPELSIEWDEALKFYALWEILGDKDYCNLFMGQIEILKKNRAKTGIPYKNYNPQTNTNVIL